MNRQVIGKLDADVPLSCHDPHFKWRRARRKAIPEHDNQCPLVKSRNIAELQHLAMTRRVGELAFYWRATVDEDGHYAFAIAL
jgi:hypothetical protein